MTLQVRIEGVDELHKRLQTISVQTRGKAGRTALRKAAAEIAEQARQNVSKLDDPKTAEDIAKNVALQFASRHFRRTGDLMFRVGILGGARSYANTTQNRRKQRVGQTYKTDGDKSNPGGDTFYWRFLELGRRGVPATPFLVPAARQAGGAAIAAFVREYNKALDRFARRGIL